MQDWELEDAATHLCWVAGAGLAILDVTFKSVLILDATGLPKVVRI